MTDECLNFRDLRPMDRANGVDRDRLGAPTRNQDLHLARGDFLAKQPAWRVADAHPREARGANDLGAVGLKVARDAHRSGSAVGADELPGVLRRELGVDDAIVAD